MYIIVNIIFVLINYFKFVVKLRSVNDNSFNKTNYTRFDSDVIYNETNRAVISNKSLCSLLF